MRPDGDRLSPSPSWQRGRMKRATDLDWDIEPREVTCEGDRFTLNAEEAVKLVDDTRRRR